MINILKKVLNFQFIRFLFVGGINTLFGYSVFAILIFFGFHYQFAILLGTILGVLFNFKTIGAFVFGHKGFNLIVLLKFVFVYSLGYILNTSGVRVLLGYIDNTYYAGLIVIIPVSIVLYFLNKKLVFSKKK